jgi:uncharacterized membrane protein YjjP (DUF1212 family)
MMFPLDFWDISLLIAVISIILLITSELLSTRLGRINVLINKRKLRTTAIIASTLFLFTVALRITAIILKL